jgi:endonuclease YncB( thermonuclease family)
MVEPGQSKIVGVASDTIEIHDQRIRLEGIDAPESKQTCSRDGGPPFTCQTGSAGWWSPAS